jgi:hypothetical protein
MPNSTITLCKVFDNISSTGECIIPISSNGSCMRIEARTDGVATFEVSTSMTSNQDNNYSLVGILINLVNISINNPVTITSTDGLVAYSLDLGCVSYVKIKLTNNTGNTTITCKVSD